MNIWDYPISFPYGATTDPYSASNPHKGADRAAPRGTPVPVNGVVIGTVGTTGFSTGNHLHLGKFKDGGHYNPGSGGETFPSATVIQVDTDGGTASGKFVRIQAGDYQWVYLHLDSVNVKVGQILQGEEMLSKDQLVDLWVMCKGRGPTEEEKTRYIGKTTYAKLRADLLASTAFKAKIVAASEGKLNPVSHLTTPLKQAYVAPAPPNTTVLGPGVYEFK